MQREVRTDVLHETGVNTEKILLLPDLPVPVSGNNSSESSPLKKTKVVKLGRKLNEKELQEKFCYLYATRGDLSGKACAAEAGYAAPAMAASRLLKKEGVQLRIEEIKNSGVPCIVRLPKQERKKLYYEHFLRLYNEKRVELRKELGPIYREYLDFRHNTTRYTRSERREGWLAANLHDRDATQYAKAYCDAKFGKVREFKMKWDKYQQKWVIVKPRGVMKF